MVLKYNIIHTHYLTCNKMWFLNNFFFIKLVRKTDDSKILWNLWLRACYQDGRNQEESLRFSFCDRCLLIDDPDRMWFLAFFCRWGTGEIYWPTIGAMSHCYVLNTHGKRLPLPLGPCSPLRSWRKGPCALSSLLFLPQLPIWFLVLDDHALPLT